MTTPDATAKAGHTPSRVPTMAETEENIKVILAGVERHKQRIADLEKAVGRLYSALCMWVDWYNGNTYADGDLGGIMDKSYDAITLAATVKEGAK
jgi:hypothetical protein